MAGNSRGGCSRGASLYAFDASWAAERAAPVAGADEAGRGALAGPLVAAAVVLGEVEVSGVNDSKALGARSRETLYHEVLQRAEAVAVVAFPAWWIDRFGVGVANREALKRALVSLRSVSGCSLADGNLMLGDDIDCLPRADSRSAAVAAASVVAKVLRDAAMRSLSEEHSEYGFEKNCGYGTRAHKLALAQVGPCRVHRFSYAGVDV